MMDGSGNIIDFNPAAQAMFGYSRDEVIGKEMASLIVPEKYRDMRRTRLAWYMYSGLGKVINKRVEIEAMRKDGSLFPVELTITETKTQKGEHIFTAWLQDITERKRVLNSLSESKERFRALANSIQNLAWMAKADGWIYWYKQWYDYTGTSAKDMEGWGWQTVHDPKELPRVLKQWRLSIDTGQPFEMVFPLRRADGVYRRFLTRIVPLKNKDGQIVHWFGTNTDIEDIRVQHEMKQRMALLTEQRNALLKINKTKDEFIALASHQLRTPASIVKQYIGMLLEGFAGSISPEQLKYIQIAYNSNDRELSIINELLKTAQIDSNKYTLNKQQHDIVAIMQAAIADMQAIVNQRKQKLTFQSAVTSVRAVVDDTELKLVFVNLLENASKYSYPNTEINITIEQKVKSIYISVADQGVGIGKDDQQRVFDKFTRINNELSDTVTGTGLGLYWVRQILILHKGSIKLTSEPGKGSVFTVRLPNE